MNVHPEAALLEVALGNATPDEELTVRGHALGCQRCASLLKTFEDLVATDKVSGFAAPVPEGVWEKLHAIVEGPERFDALAAKVATFLDVDEARAKDILHSIDGRQWQPGFFEGLELSPVEAGPARSNYTVALARLEPGACHEMHTHPAREEVFVLQGAFRTSNGEEYWRGDAARSEAGTSHEIVALPDMPCLALLATENV